MKIKKNCYICLIKPKVGKKGSRCIECNKKYQKDLYLMRKIYRKENNIKLDYVNEKTPKERLRRAIKRRTRHRFPLQNQKCKLCDNQATERHHIVKDNNLIQADSFIFTCHDCHMTQHHNS